MSKYNKTSGNSPNHEDNADDAKKISTGEELAITAIYGSQKYNKTCTASLAKIEEYPVIYGLFIPPQDWQTLTLSQFAHFRKFIIVKLVTTLSDDNNCSHALWFDQMEKVHPPLSVVCQFNAKSQLVLLKLITKKLKNIEPTDSVGDILGCWIYSILSVLQEPLSPDMCSTLRDLARMCILIRSRLPPYAHYTLYTPLNLYICIVGKYFKQYDLADK